MRLAAHGLEVQVLQGWEGRIYRDRVGRGEASEPVVHLANFPLPENRGDFGSGVTADMRGGDVFVSVKEYGSESVGTPLFRHRGRPRLTASMFSPSQLQRTLPGHTGTQVFFTAGGRPFCIYVVVAERRRLAAALPAVNAALDRLEIGTR